MSNIQKFRSNADLAKNSRFQVLLFPPRIAGGRPPGELMTLRCTDAEISGQSLQTMDFRYYGPSFKTPNQVIYSDLTLMFLTDVRMTERLFFYDWFRFITGNGSYDFAYRNEYSTEIRVEKMDERNNVVLGVKVKDAYPINIMPMPVSWADEGFLRTSVQFAYTDYEFIVDEKPR